MGKWMIKSMLLVALIVGALPVSPAWAARSATVRITFRVLPSQAPIDLQAGQMTQIFRSGNLIRLHTTAAL